MGVWSLFGDNCPWANLANGTAHELGHAVKGLLAIATLLRTGDLWKARKVLQEADVHAAFDGRFANAPGGRFDRADAVLESPMMVRSYGCGSRPDTRG
jgi:hypothetical protein